MPIPNLYLAARMACPCYWYESYKNRDLHHIQKLYYSTVPVPGIYAITAHRRHYLVAIRPIKGKKDTENIFEIGRKSYNDTTLRSKMDRTYGAFPHQKSPFRNHLITKHSNCFSPLLKCIGYRGESRIQEVDINGFKRLAQPLRIEFCAITKRWMFSSEIKSRTVKVLMCRDITCMRKSHEGCERKIRRKMFVLDDGHSWVEVGKFGKGKIDVLFTVDTETECMRRQSKEEKRASNLRLERERGRFLECDEKGGYMSLVRYFQEEKHEVGLGKTYPEMLERESAELVKLEIVRLDHERDEEEKWMLEKRMPELKHVNARKVEIREVEIVEMSVGEVVDVEV
jgi:hypothetical protein